MNARAAAGDDFGHLVHQLPEAVLVPASARDVAATVRRAAGQGRRLAAQGRRHSVFGRAQARDGIVADMGRLRTIHAVQRDRVVVDAGATWREVVEATLPHGRTPPVLTDYLDLSVGGTLAVGGVGSATSRLGVATLRLVPAPTRVRRFLLSYPDLATMLGDQRLLVHEQRFEGVQGAVLAAPTGGWTFRLDLTTQRPGDPPDDTALLAGLSDDRPKAQPSTLPYLDYLTRFTALEQLLRSNGQWWFPHPWLATFVGDAAVESVVGGELADLPPADLGPLGQVVLSRSSGSRSGARCPVPTGAGTSGRPSISSATPARVRPGSCAHPRIRGVLAEEQKVANATLEVTMSKVVFDISMSLDGFMTGANRRPEEPLGDGGERLHEWAFGEDPRDRAVLTDGVASIGAVIAGRRTYDDSVPWWGADGPTGPARVPVFVLSHDVPEGTPEGGVYTFVTGGIETALEQARAAAGEKGVAVMGGAETGQQFLRAGLVDELCIHLVPVLFGSGTRMSDNLGDQHLQLEPAETIQTAAATHLRYRVAK